MTLDSGEHCISILLMPDLRWIGVGLAMDWQDWHWIDIGLASDWNELTLDWHRIGAGLTSDWPWIGKWLPSCWDGLVLD